MQWQSFVEAYAALPVTMRDEPAKRTYTIAANPRDPARTQALRNAAAEINRRRIRAGKQLAVFQVDAGNQAGS